MYSWSEENETTQLSSCITGTVTDSILFTDYIFNEQSVPGDRDFNKLLCIPDWLLCDIIIIGVLLGATAL